MLFGNLHVSVTGTPVLTLSTPRLHSLMAWLILQGSTPQPRERAAAIFWPNSTGAQARTNLRQLLHHLKRALPQECNFLYGDNLALYWKLDDSCSIDTVQFEAAISGAANAKDRNDVLGEMEYLKRATELYVDDLLPSLYDSWLVPIRQEFRAQLSGALFRLALLLEANNEVPTAIACAEKLVAQDLLAEANHQLLMRLHVANHDRASAVRIYHQLKVLLRRELGVSPGPDSVSLFERVLKSDPPTAGLRTRPASTRGNMPAIVGRISERDLLQDTWERAASSGPRALILSGEPGVGKTRLAEELLQMAEGDGHAVARGRCYSGRGQVAYAPVATWLRSDILRRVWAQLSLFQLSELARLVPEIREEYPAADEPLSPTESWQKVKLYESLQAVIAKSSRPLLLFIDDLQWCDSDSLEWIHQLLGSDAARRILLLGTVRAEETGRDHPFSSFITELRQKALVVEVAVEPLDAIETMELARQEANEPLTEERLEDIYQWTKGNPLFVLESVRAGLQRGRVHAVINARLANLSAGSFELAGLASIVGRPFSFELLERASDWDERSLSLALEELWQRRIIEGRGGAAYDFTHDRVRDVVRAELSPVRARYLHRRVGRALTDIYSNESHEWNGQIASHYEQAGMAEQAIEHLCSAAIFARSRFAYHEAAALLRRALGLSSDLPESTKRFEQELDLSLLLGSVLVATEGYSSPEVGHTYGHALDLARRLGSTKLFASLSGLWVFHVVRGDVQTSLKDALEFEQGAGHTATSDLKLAAHFLLGSSLSHMGQMEASMHHLMIVREAQSGLSDPALEVFGGPDVRVFCRAYLSHLAWHRAFHDEDRFADVLTTEAIHTADAMRHPFIQAIALNYAAMLYALRGDSRAALKVGRQAIQLCSENAFAYYLEMANVLTAWAMATEGETVRGLEQFRLGLDSMRSLGAELRLPYYYALLGEMYGLAGLFREASASLSSGFAFASKNGEEWTVAELHRVQGDLLVEEGKFEQATSSYRKGLDSAQRCGSLAFERRLLARLERTILPLSAERS